MLADKTPRLVIVVSNGPLMIGKQELLAGRPTINIPLATPPIPLAAIATTIATGVNITTHGIVTSVSVDRVSHQVRDAVASDRRFQAFWTKSGLDISLINWPATEGDSDVSNVTSDNVFMKAKEFQHSDIVGIVLPINTQDKSTPEKVRLQQAELEAYLSSLTSETHVLLVYRRTDEEGNILNAINTIGTTLLVEGSDYDSSSATFIEVVGGAVYLLAGVPCPVGVQLPKWAFMERFSQNETRSFPLNPKKDEADWLQICKDVIASENKQGIAVLTQRFTTLISVSFKKRLWEELAFTSECLIQLRGKPFECWQQILGLHQLGNQEALGNAIEKLEEQFPKKYITSIARSLLLFQSNPEETKELLRDIDPTKMAVFHALGTLGRMCLRVGLEEKGIEAIELAIKKRTVIPVDRAQLANYFAKRDEFEKALKTLGRVGIGGEISWQELRLRILVALQLADQAKQVASNIIQIKPTHAEALKVLG
jgi:hypothetical protein